MAGHPFNYRSGLATGGSGIRLSPAKTSACRFVMTSSDMNATLSISTLKAAKSRFLVWSWQNQKSRSRLRRLVFRQTIFLGDKVRYELTMTNGEVSLAHSKAGRYFRAHGFSPPGAS